MTDTFDRLSHIHDAILKIAKYVKRGKRRFDKEEGIQNLVIYYLQIVGESSKCNSPRVSEQSSRNSLEAND